jgi:hypothetical protein
MMGEGKNIVEGLSKLCREWDFTVVDDVANFGGVLIGWKKFVFLCEFVAYKHLNLILF